ncbi:prepilin-type N-terminal cleavage/methylation domain-containing protein [Herminiimonas arsenitoxidans]|uniref:prepilin-type N-terminal cleavage/methylation domain-containing protein n=1 Tax=Herminiimonas arsenitoxidans TaxID=1809410 RepID=UPI00097033E4|nr:prepilin-type N-terminal cleavage/methylation domain-containing protein [Herminiimonas arsenitoxidans]
MRDEPCSFDAGFTLIELILVLILIGILSLYVLPRFFNKDTFDTRAFGDKARATVRYAQKIAIAQNRPVFVDFSSGRIALCFDAACTSPVNSPSTKKANAVCANSTTWMCEALPANVVTNPASPRFFFNALGRPFNIGNVEPTSTFALLTITLTGGGMNSTITIEPETGYVH